MLTVSQTASTLTNSVTSGLWTFEWLYYLGLIVVARYVFLHVGRTVYKRFLRSPTDLNRFGPRADYWAVVTGATDGIGRAYSFELAKNGFNVLLISRNKEKLIALEEKLRKKYKNKKVNVDFLEFDFANPGSSYRPIEDALAGKNIGILVNNVGVNYACPAKYLDTKPDINNDIVEVNIRALNRMTRLVLPGMIRNQRGAVINVGSLSGVVPSPMMSAYSASKAYVDFFTQALAAETARYPNIAFQSITPSMVASNVSRHIPFTQKAKWYKGIASPALIARGSLENLGQELQWSPYWCHSVIEWVLQKLPRWLVLEGIRRIHKNIRRDAKARNRKHHNHNHDLKVDHRDDNSSRRFIITDNNFDLDKTAPPPMTANQRSTKRLREEEKGRAP